MIVDGIISVLAGIMGALISTMTILVPPVPGFVYDAFGALGQVWDLVQTLDTWVPVTLAFSMAAGVTAAWLSAAAIGLLRVVVSYFTFGGGAT